MAVRFPINAYTKDQLNAMANPASVGQPEAIPFTFYDSQNFATLWTGVTFFATVQNDPTLGNIQQSNTLSAEQWFILYAITLDWLIAATTQASSGAPTIVDDLLQIMNGARAIVNLQIAMKQYIQAPIHNFHSSGGINVAYQLGTPTGSGLGNYAQNWYPDGGYAVNGSIVLLPRQTFQFTVSGVAAALVATRMGRFTMHGVLERPVR